MRIMGLITSSTIAAMRIVRTGLGAEALFISALSEQVVTTVEQKRRASTATTVLVASIMALATTVLASSTSSLAPLPSLSPIGNAYAMYDSPYICNNLYNSVITSMKIITPDHSRTYYNYDPIAYPHTTNANTITNTNIDHFNSKVGVGYTVILTLHSADKSNSGNTNTGSIWYSSNAYGYASNHCVNNVRPNSDTTITLHNVFMSTATHGTKQSITWYSWYNNAELKGPMYKVAWS